MEINGDQLRTREWRRGAWARRTSSFCSPPSSEPTRGPISSSSSSCGERREGRVAGAVMSTCMQGGWPISSFGNHR